MNRRQLLKFISNCALLPGVGRSSFGMVANSDDHIRPLKELGRSCGLLVGVQSEKFLLEIPALAQFTAQQFNLLTPGNEMKWNRLRPGPDTFNFTDADWMVNFASRNQMRVHGHNLCWNQALPRWFGQAVNKSNAQRILVNHITTVMEHFAGRMDSWDVVNEPIRVTQNRPDGLTEGPWLELLGPEYIDIAFHAAAAADPKPLRILNMDILEQDTAVHERTRQMSLRLIETLVKRGTPVQAIGLESHLDGSIPARSAGLDRFVRQVREMGLQVLITELDIDDTAVAGDSEVCKSQSASHYYDYLTDIIPTAAATRLILWTSTDKENWLDYMAPTHPVWRRADGRMHHPGLLDENIRPNPALAAVANALKTMASDSARGAKG